MALLKVVTVEKAKEELTERFDGLRMERETVPVHEAFGRFIAVPVVPVDPVPHFSRSTMDGYAVKASETGGASEAMPAFFRKIGEVEMGTIPSFNIGPEEAAYIPTGGMIPPGADSVVMVEYSEVLGDEVALTSPASPGMNILPVGQDMRPGETVLQAGRRIGSAEIGVLGSIGLAGIEVYRKPKITILSTGDELTPVDAPLEPGRIRDINALTLAAEAAKMGFEIVRTGVITDHRDRLEAAVRQAMEDSDLLFLSGGSSAGKKDYTREVFNSMGKPGCFVHGIAFNPGKPTILAEADGYPLIGLPGHPVSSLMVFRIIGRHMLYLLNGAPLPPEPWISARLMENVHASPGRDTYKLVSLKPAGMGAGKSGYEAIPVPGGSGMITTLSRADGYIIINRDLEGITAGSEVKVYQL